MLNRQHRFHGYGSLNRVYSRSQGVRGALISLRYSKRNFNKPYRVAVVVGRKVHKSAVRRNRIRRRIYEVVRKSEITPENTDLILTVYDEKVAVMANSELEGTINELFQKANKNLALDQSEQHR